MSVTNMFSTSKMIRTQEKMPFLQTSSLSKSNSSLSTSIDRIKQNQQTLRTRNKVIDSMTQNHFHKKSTSFQPASTAYREIYGTKNKKSTDKGSFKQKLTVDVPGNLASRQNS